jgi:hypothetical protein
LRPRHVRPSAGTPGETPPDWFVAKFKGDLEKALQKWPKAPRIKWEKYQTTPATEAEINGWFAKWPGMNIGLATGRPRGSSPWTWTAFEGLKWAKKTLR